MGLLKDKTISFVGAGRMAQALLTGLAHLKIKKIKASEPVAERRKFLKKLFPKVPFFEKNLAVLGTDVLVLAVKPQIIKHVAQEIKNKISPRTLIISIAAGIPLVWLEKQFPKNSVVRVMPNNPARIGAGISALCAGRRAAGPHKKIAQEIFSSVGQTIWVKENFMNLITAISGSGPAFFYYFVEALAESGYQAGLPEELALELAIQTGLGSLKMLEQAHLKPKELINQVASPAGTTIAGLKVLESGGFKNLIKKTIAAAARRSAELSRIE